VEPTEDGGVPDPLVGRLIKGKYHVTGQLATGSLGVTYLAQQQGRAAGLVVKVFRGEFTKTKEFVERLHRQMMALAALSKAHRQIVRVYDCDQADDGSLFIVMEQIEGRTLHELLRQGGALEIDRALSLAVEMAEGLNAAHDAGLVHTDVHPKNVLVLGDEDTVKLIGFERARLKKAGAMDHLVPATQITRTPEYAAPEQIQRGEITKQTDIYAFGIVLYEMLTGVVPFRASTPDAVLAMHLGVAPTPPKALRAEIPVEVEAQVLRALEKEPKWRQNSANEVIHEFLQRVAAARAVRVGRPTRERGSAADAAPAGEQPAPRPRVGVRWTVAAIVGLLIVLAAALFWVVYPRWAPEETYQPPPRPQPSETLMPGPAPAGESETKAPELPAPPSPVQPLPERVLPEAPSKERGGLAEKESTSPPKVGQTKSPRRTRPPASPQDVAPGAKRGSPDAADIIDWLLKQQ
jgi:predicted Ser/Thr protein kinase